MRAVLIVAAVLLVCINVIWGSVHHESWADYGWLVVAGIGSAIGGYFFVTEKPLG